MANSELLSTLHIGMDIGGRSHNADQKLFDVMAQVGKDIEEKYNVPVTHVKSMRNTELYEGFPEGRQNHELQCLTSGIRPDGGILLVNFNGHRMPICVGENKKQGDGKDQARGNAIERSAKNIMWFQSLMKEEGILPYVIFAYGKDFEEGSYILDRTSAMTHFKPFNVIHLEKEKGGTGGASIFTSDRTVNAFSSDKMYKILYEIAERALFYYKSKGLRTGQN